MLNPKTITDSDALLLYRVGPVLCCSSTRSVESVVVPPSMKKPPGVDELRPGIFRHVSGIVSIVDLRVAFGVNKERRSSNGRVIIVKFETGSPGFWVDEIIDVIEYPEKGWGQLPALIPRDVFEKILVLNEKIQLYCDFENLNACKKTGYLREYIERLDEEDRQKDDVIYTKNESDVDRKQQLSSEKATSKFEHKEKSAAGAEIEVPVQIPASSKSDNTYDIKSTSSIDLDESAKPSVQKAQSEERNNENIKNENDIEINLEKKLSSGEGSVAGHGQVDGFKNDTFNFKKDISEDYVVKRDPSSPQKITQPGSKTEYDDDKYDNTWQFSVVVIGLALLLALAVYYLLDNDLPNNDYLVNSRVIDMDELSLTDIESPVITENESAIGYGSEVDITDESDKEATSDTSTFEANPGLSENVGGGFEKESMLTEGAISIEKDDQGYVIVVDHTGNDSGLSELNEITNREKSADITEETLAASEGEQVENISEKPIELQSNEEYVLSHEQEKNIELVIIPKELVKIEPSYRSISESKTSKKNVSRHQILHIVVKGDTLWHIAKRYIHNPYRYPELARLSNIKNPDLIYPGDRVKIIILDRE